jgi:hypothetical protein
MEHSEIIDTVLSNNIANINLQTDKMFPSNFVLAIIK